MRITGKKALALSFCVTAALQMGAFPVLAQEVSMRKIAGYEAGQFDSPGNGSILSKPAFRETSG